MASGLGPLFAFVAGMLFAFALVWLWLRAMNVTISGHYVPKDEPLLKPFVRTDAEMAAWEEKRRSGGSVMQAPRVGERP